MYSYICKEYFEGENTQNELEMLFNLKNKKRIFPFWWEDVNHFFLILNLGNLEESND
ncbi:MAG: hypothetical protein ACTSU2_16955 [Promethearchaeota archaeon]